VGQARLSRRQTDLDLRPTFQDNNKAGKSAPFRLRRLSKLARVRLAATLSTADSEVLAAIIKARTAITNKMLDMGLTAVALDSAATEAMEVEEAGMAVTAVATSFLPPASTWWWHLDGQRTWQMCGRPSSLSPGALMQWFTSFSLVRACINWALGSKKLVTHMIRISINLHVLVYNS
jgi:hypothetical protein